MNRNDNVCISLYSSHQFRGKFYLKYGDAKQIEFWWLNQQRDNYVRYELIAQF